MIIARADTPERIKLLLGLSAGNLARLEAGKPMHLKPETHPGLPPGMEILIVYGLTEQAMERELREAGLIGSHTKVTKDPRLGPG